MAIYYRDGKRVAFSEREKQIILSNTPLPDVTIAEYYTILIKLDYSKDDFHTLELMRTYGFFLIAKDHLIEMIRHSGLNPYEIHITDIMLDYNTDSNGPWIRNRLLIWGIPTTVWCMLYSKDKPKFYKTRIGIALSYLKRTGKDELIPLLLKRYQKEIHSENVRFVKQYDLPASLVEERRYPLVTMDIDGIPTHTWQLLNDPNYVPQKTHLILWIREFEEKGATDIAEDLRDRFRFILDPVELKPILTDRQIKQAKDRLRHLLSREYTKQLIAALEGQPDDYEEEDEVYEICS